MARRRRPDRPPLQLPDDLVPDLDDWGSEAEEDKRRRRSQWLHENDAGADYFFDWLPAHLAERRRLAGLPPKPPATRKGPLPPRVRKVLEQLDPPQNTP